MNHLFKKDFNDQILRKLCGKYGIEADSAVLIKEDSNLVYDCGDKILRVSHSSIRGSEVIASELDWMEYLLQKNVSVARILRSNFNRSLERATGVGCYFTAVCFEKILGQKISKSSWNEALFQELGELAGRIHRVNAYYAPSKELKFQHWNELVECSYTSFLPEDERGFKALCQRLMNEFSDYPRSPQNYGLIHNDIHFENFLLTGGDNKVVLFDFEVACRSWYLYEISTALYYASQVNGHRNDRGFEQRFLTSFLEGYRREYTLGPIEFETILKFMLYRDLFLIGYVNSIWRQEVMTKPRLKLINEMEASVTERRRRLGW